jgi:hypothetical protein
MERRDERCRRVPILLSCLLLCAPLAAETRLLAGGIARDSREDLLAQAVHAATEKLAQPACAAILSDFRDAEGRTLQENLDATGQSPSGYLGLLVFFDGAGASRCEDRSILATTTPGSRVVTICTPQFFARQRRDPAIAPVLLIHEALHSLGLGEKPPSSLEITSAVIARCGR